MISTGEEVVEGLPIVDVFLWLEIRPDEARIDGADVDDLFQSLQGRFAAHRRPALAGIAKDGRIFGEDGMAFDGAGGARKKENVQEAGFHFV